MDFGITLLDTLLLHVKTHVPLCLHTQRCRNEDQQAVRTTTRTASHSRPRHSGTKMLPNNSTGKKSHACGPCRRLKRKCDLQVPCSTCKSGRKTKVEECMANPARPLNNIQELIAANAKFGRVHPAESSASSPDESPLPDSGIKRARLGSAVFSQFEVGSEDQKSPLMPLSSIPAPVPLSSIPAPVPLQLNQHQPLFSSASGSDTLTNTPTAVDQATAHELTKQVEWQNQQIKALTFENAQNRHQISALKKELSTKESIPTPPGDGWRPHNTYKRKYTKLLPSKVQTNLLVDFYLQNVDYVYRPLHHPTFKKTLEEFWYNEEEVDIGWLSTLFMVLGLAAIHLPKGLINISSEEIQRSHVIWFDASKECVSIADSLRKCASMFNLHILQWFSLCQLYFYATRRAEQLTDILHKAIKDAHAMGLDKDDKDNPNLLELEMKRRLWWDICGCDTFRALSLGTKPSIRSYNSVVPFPSNCNDADMTPDSIKVRSINQPTDNSFNIYRALMMKIMNGMFEKKHQVTMKDMKILERVTDKTFRGLVEIDIELCHTNKSWFFEIDKEGALPHTLDSKIHFQHHMLHTCICIHRFRLYQNYLQEGIPVALEVARTTAKSLFSVYKRLRTMYDLKNPLFLPAIHQGFTGSIIQSMMILVGSNLSKADQTSLFGDIELLLSDLQVLSEDGFILKPEILKESFKVLNSLKKSITKNIVLLEKDQKDILSNVFGGKQMTESYLNKCTVSFIIDQSDETRRRQEQEEQQEQFQESYSYWNQLGVVVDDQILESSMAKFNEIDLQRLQHAQQTSQRKPIISHPRAANSETLPCDTVEGEEAQQLEQSSQSGEERNKRGTTPFELNLNDIDTFWDDMGQQGLDELKNMYYSEFSGYKIV